MNVPDELQCLFHAEIEERGDTYVIEVPKREVTSGTIRSGQVHRVGLFQSEVANAAPSMSTDAMGDDAMERQNEPDQADETESTASQPAHREASQTQRADAPAPPVREGDQRTVDIEDIGEQGDGIARVDRGYIVIVPDTEQGERVTIEITDVAETVGFAEVVSRKDYYE